MVFGLIYIKEGGDDTGYIVICTGGFFGFAFFIPILIIIYNPLKARFILWRKGTSISILEKRSFELVSEIKRIEEEIEVLCVELNRVSPGTHLHNNETSPI